MIKLSLDDILTECYTCTRSKFLGGNSLKGIEEFVNSIVSGIIDKDTEKKEIGKISEELKLKFQKMVKEKDILANKMQMQQDVYKAEMELKLLKEFGDRVDFYADLKDELWLEITNELGVPEEGNYSLNHKTGIVSEKIKKGSGKDSKEDVMRKLQLSKRPEKGG
jgi:hypothetical protein